MAKLILLLCLAAVLAVALADRAHRVDRRSSSFDGVRGHDLGRFRRPSQRFFGRPADESGARSVWRRRHDILQNRNGRRSHRVHRMGQTSPLKSSEQGIHRISRQRMMDNLRADLQRFQETSRGGQVPGISSLRDANRRLGGFHRLDRLGGQMDLTGYRLDQRNRADGYLSRDAWRGHHQSGRLRDTPVGFGDGPFGGANRGNGMGPGYLGP